MLLHEAETLLSRGRGADPCGYKTKKIANNTYLVERDEGVAVRLHKTDIVLFKMNGSVVLNSNGWRTITTKKRMNSYLPSWIGVYQLKGKWYVLVRSEVGEIKRYFFKDYMEITQDSRVYGTFLHIFE